jgi:hypothetical protein
MHVHTNAIITYYNNLQAFTIGVRYFGVLQHRPVCLDATQLSPTVFNVTLNMAYQ